MCCDLNGLAPDDVVVELLPRPTSETDLSPVGGGFTAMDSHHVSDVNRGDASRAYRLEPVGQTAEGERVSRQCDAGGLRKARLGTRVPLPPRPGAPFRHGYDALAVTRV